mmetsp:Transcript_29838/g.81892  ORF Transcript_29838/g.81892 Transcript_29838/m.81892 type:complete len:227 (-) Transcript_29838:34-714(-)
MRIGAAPAPMIARSVFGLLFTTMFFIALAACSCSAGLSDFRSSTRNGIPPASTNASSCSSTLKTKFLNAPAARTRTSADVDCNRATRAGSAPASTIAYRILFFNAARNINAPHECICRGGEMSGARNSTKTGKPPASRMACWCAALLKDRLVIAATACSLAKGVPVRESSSSTGNAPLSMTMFRCSELIATRSRRTPAASSRCAGVPYCRSFNVLSDHRDATMKEA